MINGIKYKMICLKLYYLVAILSLTTAIRVDWNTNTGPIVPPTSTLPPTPLKPYRSPAPVWEDQNNDIPNPNPYQYVLPPPSRPKPATDNYARAPITSQQQETFYKQQQQQNYGQIITKYPNSNNNNNNIYYKRVPGLAVQYIPNYGFKYNAIVPSPSSSTLSGKSYYLKENDIYDEKFNGKLNGKYNAKLKKYKAYEKIKYFPQIYYTTPLDYDYFQQQLPYPQQQTQYHQQTNDEQIITSTQQNVYQQLPPQQNQQSVAVTTSLDQTKPQTFTNSPHVQTTQATTNLNNNNNSQGVTTKYLENSPTESGTNLR